jgi:hypothetical protein
LPRSATPPHKGGIQRAQDGGEVSIIRADFQHKERYICAFLALSQYLENTDYEINHGAYHYYQLAGDRGTTLELDGRNFRPDGIVFSRANNPKRSPFMPMSWRSTATATASGLFSSYANTFTHSKRGVWRHVLALITPILSCPVFTAENTAVMRSVIDELQTDPDTWAYMRKLFMFAELDELDGRTFTGLAPTLAGIKNQYRQK